MASTFFSGCQQAASSVCDQLQAIPSTINCSYNAIGRKIEHLTSRFPSPLNRIVVQAYWGLPYTACLFICPSPIAYIAAFCVNIAASAVRENLSRTVSQRLFLGTRNFCILQAAKCTMQSVIFPPLAITAVSYIFLAMYAHGNASTVNQKF